MNEHDCRYVARGLMAGNLVHYKGLHFDWHDYLDAVSCSMPTGRRRWPCKATSLYYRGTNQSLRECVRGAYESVLINLVTGG